MLQEDILNGWLGVYNKPPIKKTLFEKIIYAIKKPVYDNIIHPMRWKMINLTCFIKGHIFKMPFKPDLRKNRPHTFHFWCDRCLTNVDVTLTKKDKPAQTGV